MPKLISVKRLENDKKKYIAYFLIPKDGKYIITHTKFGDPNYQDYLEHKDKKRRERYRIRHKKDIKEFKPFSPAYLSYYISWGDSTDIKKNIEKYNKIFLNVS